MPAIAYDSTNEALYSPALRPTLFVAGQQYSHVQLALECARLAYARGARPTVVADGLQEALERVGFEHVTLFSDARTGTQGFGAVRRRDGLAILAFRGTEPEEVADLAIDLDAASLPCDLAPGRVHIGFVKALESVLAAVTTWRAGLPDGHALVVCGHSLGAALATLAASVLRPTLLVTAGSPRVGNDEFARSLAGVDIVRVVDCCDLVCQLPPHAPPWYVHVGPATYIDGNGDLHQNPGAIEMLMDQGKARVWYTLQRSWRRGHVPVRDLADHAPINYLRGFFQE